MTWLVEWGGRTLDADPFELTGQELSEIKKRTGLTFGQLLEGVSTLDGDAVQGLFWAIERRENPDLKFTDYAGPPVRAVLQAIDALNTLAAEEAGKASPAAGSTETTATDGSPSSPSTSEPSTEQPTTA